MKYKHTFQALKTLFALTCLVFSQLGCKLKDKPTRSNGSLRFYEVYNIDEIGTDLINANNKLAKILDSITNHSKGMAGNIQSKKDTTQFIENSISKKFPLTKFLVYDGYIRDRKNQMVVDATSGKPSYFSEIGGVIARDTGTLGQYLRMPEILALFPEGIKFLFGNSIYETNTVGEKTGVIGLYALKTVNMPGGAKLKGDHVKYVGIGYNAANHIAVDIELDYEGRRIFAKLTRDNVGQPIAIALNDYVCTAPRIMSEINGGKLQISGNYTPEATNELANAIKSATGADRTLFR